MVISPRGPGASGQISAAMVSPRGPLGDTTDSGLGIENQTFGHDKYFTSKELGEVSLLNEGFDGHKLTDADVRKILPGL